MNGTKVSEVKEQKSASCSSFLNLHAVIHVRGRGQSPLAGVNFFFFFFM